MSTKNSKQTVEGMEAQETKALLGLEAGYLVEEEKEAERQYMEHCKRWALIREREFAYLYKSGEPRFVEPVDLFSDDEMKKREAREKASKLEASVSDASNVHAAVASIVAGAGSGAVSRKRTVTQAGLAGESDAKRDRS